MTSKRKRDDAAKDPIEAEAIDPADQFEFFCLGGGQEVGRSCHIIRYKGKTVMLDAGMHPGYEGLAALPFYDEWDLSTVDVLLISHFHVDHAASLPYVLAKTNFKGRVYMTHPTKAIYRWLITDTVRVGNLGSSAENRTILYTEAEHLATFPRIEAIDYYTTHTVSSIRITPYPAGHVLGAAMYLVEIAGLNILFTGDYSREEDRHLVSASIPKGINVDVLITESTFGTATHVPRVERENQLTKTITDIVSTRKGRALLPVFALGTAQELLLILDDYWARHPNLQSIPIYYASNLARRCMAIYSTYTNFMNANIKRLFYERMRQAEEAGQDPSTAGPWDLRFVRALRSLERFEDIGSCVMLATPGMMQNGASRELLEKWAPDPKNGVIITGYSVEGTMAQKLLNEPDTIEAVMTKSRDQAGGRRALGLQKGAAADAQNIQRRCTVNEYSFAAHVDGRQNTDFVEEVRPRHIILVHGSKGQGVRLRSKLLGLRKEGQALHERLLDVHHPANTVPVTIGFKTDKIAKVVGKLAESYMPLSLRPKSNAKDIEAEEDDEDMEGTRIKQGKAAEPKGISGVLVQNEFKLSLMAPEDLKEFAGLTTTTVVCREHLTLRAAGIELIRWALQAAFGEVTEVKKQANALNSSQNAEDSTNGYAATGGDMMAADAEIDRTTTVLEVMGTVRVSVDAADGSVEVEWEGNMLNDGIADAVLGVLLGVERSPAAVARSSKMHGHSHGYAHDNDIVMNGTANGTSKKRSMDPKERLSRLFLLLEAQFGADSIVPIEEPPEVKSTADDEEDEAAREKEMRKVLERLHSLGIPVPGIEIKLNDSVTAKVWLEDLSVECGNNIFKGRVENVVREAVEGISPLWG